ncbi:hypothetical protein [Streptomyces sp. NPDC007172]|uniref:hypothetical protein n=1 Tax=Streptomyces sp. NPDC007172 TaxID=3364776 RepID=UPI0036AD1C20
MTRQGKCHYRIDATCNVLSLVDSASTRVNSYTDTPTGRPRTPTGRPRTPTGRPRTTAGRPRTTAVEQ